MRLTELLLAVASVAVPAGFSLWRAHLGGKGYYFTIQVSPDSSVGTLARRVRNQYTTQVFGIALFALVAILLFSHDTVKIGVILFSCCGETIALAAAWAWAWNRMLPYRTEHTVVRTASLVEDSSSRKAVMTCLGAALPLFAVSIYLIDHFADIPETFAKRFDAAGHCIEFVKRTPASIFQPVLAGLAVVGSISLLMRMLPFFTPGTFGRPPLVRLMRRVFIGAAWMIGVFSAADALLPLAKDPPRYAELLARISLGAGLALVALIVVSCLCSKNLVPVQKSTEAQHWKAGLWYYNPNDSALLVPNRIGYGYTLNLARPTAWALVLGTLSLILGLIAVGLCSK